MAGFTWPWWAPTATVVAAVSPWDPTGGAAGRSVSVPARMPVRPAVPWQKVQVVCQAGKPAVVWQALHELPATPDAVPKATWQLVQVCRPAALAW